MQRIGFAIHWNGILYWYKINNETAGISVMSLLDVESFGTPCRSLCLPIQATEHMDLLNWLTLDDDRLHAHSLLIFIFTL